MGRPAGEAGREYARKWVAARRAAWFIDKSCVVCGSKKKLEIHHIKPDTKVSHNVWSWSEVNRDAELAKCEVRCEEHHMDKTKEQLRNAPRKLLSEKKHGTGNTYTDGCRCSLCKQFRHDRYLKECIGLR